MPEYHQRSFDPSLPYPALVKNCDLLMVSLLGSRSAINTYLERWFLDGTDGHYRAAAWSPTVLAFINYGQVGVRDGGSLSFNALGSAPYAEAALVVPTVLIQRLTAEGKPCARVVARPWDMSYIFASNLLAVITTRDVWGYAKTLGTVERGVTTDGRETHRVSAEVLDQYGPDQVWKTRELFSLTRQSRETGTSSPAGVDLLSDDRPPLALPFATEDGEIRVVVDSQGGVVWLDDPADPLPEGIADQLPRLQEGELLGPDGPLSPDLDVDVVPTPGLPGASADDALRQRLSSPSAASLADAAVYTFQASDVLQGLPSSVLGLNQQRTAWDPTKTEHRHLTLGSLKALASRITSIEGLGSWKLDLGPPAVSHPFAADLGLRTQHNVSAMRMELHMVVEAAKVLWSVPKATAEQSAAAASGSAPAAQDPDQA